jgi:hypothetical protein
MSHEVIDILFLHKFLNFVDQNYPLGLIKEAIQLRSKIIDM